MLAMLIVALLLGIALPSYEAFVDRARVAQAVTDIGSLDMRIERFASDRFAYPRSLDELGGDVPLDPWGRPYQFLLIRGNDDPGISGSLRKDRNLVPINSDYDLYSLGEDGQSRPPLTAPPSLDDVVRAADGSFVGSAEEF